MTVRSGRVRPRASSGAGRRGGFALACLFVLLATFLLGMLAGRQWARSYRPGMEVEKGKRPVLAGRAAAEDRSRPRPSEIQEKLTFYHTLTAPLAAPPSRHSPNPRDANQASSPAPDSQGPTPGQSWTVQVAAYLSPGPADALQRSLAESGYDAYVVQFTGEDGKVRYRVRVGSYPNRGEAQKVSERVRAERAFAPLIVPR